MNKRLKGWVTSFVAGAALLLRVASATADTQPYHENFYVYLRMSAPAASPPIGDEFAGYPALNRDVNLYGTFAFRKDRLMSLVDDEARQSLESASAQLRSAQASVDAAGADVAALTHQIDDALTAEPAPGTIGAPVPDPAAAQFRSVDPAFAGREHVLYHRLNTAQPVDATRVQAKQIALETLRAADEADVEGERSTGLTLLGAAESLGDFALSVTPVVSVGKDLYEAVTGKRLINGETLTGLERGVAVAGILSLGMTDEIAAVSRALVRVGERVGVAGVEQAVHLGEAIAKALGHEGLGKYASREYSENAVAFVGKLTGSERGAGLTSEVYNTVAANYTRMETMIAGMSGKVVEGVETRAIVREFRAADGTVVRNTEESVFKIFEKNKFSEHRYSIGGEYGNSALYATQGTVAEAKSTVLAEAKLSESEALIAQRNFRLEKALDLSDANLIDQLGLTKAQLIAPDEYKITQQLGDIARALGFDGVVAESVGGGAINVVHF